MTIEAPHLVNRTAEDTVKDVDGRAYDAGFSWPSKEGTAGRALVQLFGRLGELLTNRLDQVADKHFLAFLDRAGLSLTPPRPARTELTFASAADGPAVIRVPARTQVATVPSETQPEVIFETEDDLAVVFNEWVGCIVVDPTSYADRTDRVDQTPEDTFPVFRGQAERERVFYLRAGDLLAFSDEAARKCATVTLGFEFAVEGNPCADGWILEWLYWDGKDWAVLPKVRDGTQGFSRDGQVEFTELPEMKETEVGGLLFSLGVDVAPDADGNEFLARVARELEARGMPVAEQLAMTVEKPGEAWQVRDEHQAYHVTRSETTIDVHVSGEAGFWIACRLTGGNIRDHLPALASIRGWRRIDITAVQPTTADVALGGVQSNTVLVPIDLKAEFFPFGQRPAQLDTFYLMSNEAFSKPGARVTITTGGLEGIPDGVESDDLNALAVRWEYYSTAGWTQMGVTRRAGGSTSDRLGFKDTTSAFTVAPAGESAATVTFTVPTGTTKEPAFRETVVNGLSGYWIRASIIGGSYNVPARVEGQGILNMGGYKFYEGHTYAPFVKQWRLTYTGYSSSTGESPLTVCRSRVDGMLRDHFSALASRQECRALCSEGAGPSLLHGLQEGVPRRRHNRALDGCRGAR